MLTPADFPRLTSAASHAHDTGDWFAMSLRTISEGARNERALRSAILTIGVTAERAWRVQVWNRYLAAKAPEPQPATVLTLAQSLVGTSDIRQARAVCDALAVTSETGTCVDDMRALAAELLRLATAVAASRPTAMTHRLHGLRMAGR